MIVRVDASRVAVRKIELYRVLPDRRCGLRTRLGLEHGQQRRRRKSRRSFTERFFFEAFVVARRARTILAQIRKIEMAGVTVNPGNVHTRAAAYMNLHAGGLAALVDRQRHRSSALGLLLTDLFKQP